MNFSCQVLHDTLFDKFSLRACWDKKSAVVCGICREKELDYEMYYARIWIPTDCYAEHAKIKVS